MKKFLLGLMTVVATSVLFAHHNAKLPQLHNSKKYHSFQDGKTMHMHLEIGERDGKTYANIGEFGQIMVVKTANGYMTENGSAIIKRIDKKGNLNLELNILLFDRAFYKPEKFEKETSFHSYNKGFPHVHLDLSKDMKTATIGDYTFNIIVTKTTAGDRIIKEEKGLFTVILYSTYDDIKTNLPKLSRTGKLIINSKFFEIKNKMKHSH